MRAAQEGSAYRQILLSTVGIVFLATPFRNSDAPQWKIVVGGIMGEQTPKQLVDDLNSRDKELQKLTQMFGELANHESVQLHVCCFYERRKTEMLRRFTSTGLVTKLSAAFNSKTHKIVCCLLKGVSGN